MDAEGLRNHLRLRTLEAFRQVYDTGSVTRAAERLGVSQPAVSQAVFALERAVGFSLFHRNGTKRLAPTPEGRELYPACCRVLDATAAVEKIATTLEPGQGLRITIGVIPEMSVGFAQEVMERLLGRFPAVEVGLDARYARLHEELLTRGEVDICISSFPPPSERVDAEELMAMPALVAMPAGHRLAKRKVVRAADLAGEPLAIPRRPTVLRTLIEEAFAVAGATPVPAVEAPSFTLADFVVRRQVAAIFGPIVGWHHRHRGIVLRPLDPPVRCDVFLLQRRGGELSPYARAFRDEVVALGREVAADLGIAIEIPTGAGRPRRRPAAARRAAARG